MTETKKAKKAKRAEHTPGKWEWVKRRDYPETELRGPDGQQVLAVYESHGGGSMPGPEDRALVAAAPDLLEALEKADEYISERVALRPDDHVRTATLRAVRVAISKARGLNYWTLADALNYLKGIEGGES